MPKKKKKREKCVHRTWMPPILAKVNMGIRGITPEWKKW
jgi:hypothetical protein